MRYDCMCAALSNSYQQTSNQKDLSVIVLEQFNSKSICKMTTKICVYQNCNNKSTTATNLTFFSFPLKDEEKCKIWTERAGCSFQPNRTQYLCEAHFAQKYISRTPRRTILLPPAVPIWYNNQDKTEDSKILHQHDEVHEEYLNIDATTIEDDTRIVFMDELRETVHDEDPNYIQDHLPKNKSTLIKLPTGVKVVPLSLRQAKINKQLLRSREIEHQSKAVKEINNQHHENIVKKVKLSTEHSTIFDEDLQSAPNQNDANQVADTHVIDHISAIPEISTFIFKGEECLQMPKRLYLEQRAEIINELNKYKGIVEQIQKTLGEL